VAGTTAASPASQTAVLPGLHATSYTITLITGDQVKLTAAGTSGRYAITATPAPRPGGTVPQIQVTGTDSRNGGIMYAIPSDAAPLITAGRLDQQLFNIGYLAAHGDTSVGGHLPVTLHYTGHPDAATLARDAARLPGATLTATHPQTSTLTVRLATQHATTFWAALTHNTAAAAGQADARLADGIRNVTSGATTPAPATHPASEPLNTVTETITARDNSGDCAVNQTVCAYSLDYLVNINGTGGLINPTSYSCVNSDPCSIMQVQWTVPAGTYMSDVWAEFEAGDRTQRAYVEDPQFTVSGDTSIAFDLNNARVLTPSTPQPTEPYSQVTAVYRGYPGYPPGDGYSSITFSSYGDYWWATPTQPVTLGSFHLSTEWILGKPMLTMAVTAPEPLALHPMYPDLAADVGAVVRFSGRKTLPLAYAGTGTRKDFTGLNVHGKLVMIRIQQGGNHGDTCGVSNSPLHNALQAGAAGVLIDPINPHAVGGECGLPIGYAYSTTGKHPHIPLAAVPLDEANTLLGLLSLGPVKISVADSGPARYLYNLKFDTEDQIPSTLANTVTSKQLTLVNASYHASKPETATDAWSAWASDESTVGGVGYEIAAPASIPEYFGPLSPGTVYDLSDSSGDIYTVFSRHRSSAINWGELPTAPGAVLASPAVQQAQPGQFTVAYCSACRQGDTFYPLMYLVSADPEQIGTYTADDPSTLALYQDGQEIQPAPVDGVAAYQLPAQKARYQLTLDGGDTSTSWDFTSAEPATDHTPTGLECAGTALGVSAAPCQSDPLVFLRYDAGLNLANAWTAPGAHQLQVTAYHQAAKAPAITSLKLWTSINGGATWKKATLSSGGNGTYTTAITIPKPGSTSGTVSIKAQAQDAAGNDVTQIIYDAWNLTAASG
jgi:hypothetical protein